MSRWLPGVLRSQVARRLLMLFLLSAFLPLALIAAISLVQVRDLLLHQADQRIAATAKAFGLSAFERLNAAREVLSAVAGRQLAATAPLVDAMFEEIATEDRSGSRAAVAGRLELPALSARAWERLAQGQATALVGASSQVVLAVGAPAGEAWLGRVRPTYLWGGFEELPTATELCVVDDPSRAILFCHAPDGGEALRKYAQGATQDGGTATWREDAQTHRARAWALFMGAGFGTGDWIVVASQQEVFLLARLMEQRRVYIPALVLALLLVGWFTLRQSTSIVEPLGRLAARAREIAAGRFAGRVGLERDDEFGALGSAFDSMSERLGRQFAALRGLGEIDALILGAEDTTLVIRTVVRRLGESTTAQHVTVTTFDTEDDASVLTYYAAADAPEEFLFDRRRARPGEIDSLPPESLWMPLPTTDPPPAWLSHAGFEGLGGALVQPIAWRGSMHGVIVLGYRQAQAPAPEEVQNVREMADRISVAVSSAWRDEQIYERTHFDPLTGAPNRLLFHERLGMQIERSSAEKGRFAVMVVNLDRFKTVNDSFGHSVGDLVLREAASRIRGCIRPEDTLARLGADEFAVLATNLDHAGEAKPLMDAILAQMSRAFPVEGDEVFLGASMGIAFFPDDATSAEDLLKRADTAVHRAKDEGRAQGVFFEEHMNTEVVGRVTLDRELRAAFERGELQVHYQPQVDLATGRIVAAEALLRWLHPTRGMISPTRFIPLAEESGFIETLGLWVIEQACDQIARWREAGLDLEHVAVNVSPRQFRQRDLATAIAARARARGVPASALQIEITEGLLIGRGHEVESLLAELAQSGHSLALDDFGTGFSSLSYLQRLQVDTIKIDQTFIRPLGGGEDSRAIVTAMIAMSHALGKIIVAEGVETVAQARILRGLACDRIQGYLVSPAVDGPAFARLPRTAILEMAPA